jgi:integrase
MRKQIHPAIEKLEINKRIGWHTFRHSYSTLLRNLGTDIKVQQDLLRHSVIPRNFSLLRDWFFSN